MMQDIITLVAILICTIRGQAVEDGAVQMFRIQQPALSFAVLQAEAVNPMKEEHQLSSSSSHLTYQEIPRNIYELEQQPQQMFDTINRKPFRGPLLIVDDQLPTRDDQLPTRDDQLPTRDDQLPTRDDQPLFNSVYSVAEELTQQKIQQADLRPLSSLIGSTISEDLATGNSDPNGPSPDSVHSIPRTSFIVPSPRDDVIKNNEVIMFPDDGAGSESLLFEHVRPSSGDLLSTDFVELKRVVEETQVLCKKDYMTVTFKFSSPFSGLIYPYQLFSECMLLRGHNQRSAVLTLRHGFCGRDMLASASDGGRGVDRAVFEHRLVVQWEAEFVSEDDTNVVVRCDRPDHYNRTVAWTVGAVDLPSSVHRGTHPGMWPDILSSNKGSHGKHPGPQLWMTIAHGEGPDAPSLKAEDVVHVGDVLTIVFTLSDPVFWFDSNILSCYAFDGVTCTAEETRVENVFLTLSATPRPGTLIEGTTFSRTAPQRERGACSTSKGALQPLGPQQACHGSGEGKRPQWEDAVTVHPQHAHSSHMLVVENGCSTRHKLFSHFIKQRKIGADDTKISLNYAHFKAFRFPTSLKLQIECNVEVCYEACRKPNLCSVGFQPRRRRRSVGADEPDAAHQLDRVRFRRSLEVYLMGSPTDEKPPGATGIQCESPDLACFPPNVFFGTVITLAVCVVIMALLLFLCSFRSSGVRPVFLTPGKLLR